MSDLSWLLGAMEQAEDAVPPVVPNVPNAPKPDWVHNAEIETLAVTGFAECVPNVPSVPNEKQAPRENHFVFSVSVSFGWLIHFLDRDPMYVTFSPEVDHAGAMAGYPDAVAAEPMPCAVSVAVPVDAPDDRITCRQCKHLSFAGACSVAAPGAVVSAVKGYRPAPDLLQRCGAFNQKGTK